MAVRIDGNIAGREYSPPHVREYPKHQEKVKEKVNAPQKRSSEGAVRPVWSFDPADPAAVATARRGGGCGDQRPRALLAAATWLSTFHSTWLPGGVSSGSYVQA